jgi:hypothetical protein
VPKTHDLILSANFTAQTRFPLGQAPLTSEEFLPADGKIFTIAAPSSGHFVRSIAAIETMRV